MISTVLQTFGPSTVNVRTVISFSDLIGFASTTGTINLPLGYPGVTTPVVPRGTYVKNVRIKHTASFTGGAITAVTVSVGSAAGSATSFAGAFNIFQAVADTTLQGGPPTVAQVTYAADTITAVFTSTSANLSALTAGVVNIDVEMWLEPDLLSTAQLTNTPVPQGSGGGLI
jgi:hypothetical protein